MDAVTAFAFTIAMLALGKLLARSGLVHEQAPHALNQVVLYVCLPASILLHASKLRFDPHLVGLVLLPWLLLALSAALVFAAARALRFSRADTGLLLLAIPLGNTSFLGYPLIAALLGEGAVQYAVIYDQFGTFLMLSSYGLVVLALYGHGERPSAARIARRVATFPPFLALLVALLLMPDEPPAALELVLRRLADALLPLVTLATGMQLKLRLPREHLGPLAVGLTGKLVLLPLLALGLATFAGASGDVRAVAVLESAMPCMITAMALAASAGLTPPLAAAYVGYSTALSVITLPLWRWLIG